jgi:hypothetical protein
MTQNQVANQLGACSHLTLRPSQKEGQVILYFGYLLERVLVYFHVFMDKREQTNISNFGFPFQNFKNIQFLEVICLIRGSLEVRCEIVALLKARLREVFRANHIDPPPEFLEEHSVSSVSSLHVLIHH